MSDEIVKPLSRMTAKERAQMTYMMDIGRRIEWDLHNAIDQSGFIPEEWHRIAKETPRARRVKITMRVGEDVLRFFRSVGTGHLPRMADVLEVYMRARLAGIVRGAETINHFRRREDYHDGPRPEFGGVAKTLGEAWEDAEAPEGFAPKPTSAERIASLRAMIAERDRREKEEGR